MTNSGEYYFINIIFLRLSLTVQLWPSAFLLFRFSRLVSEVPRSCLSTFHLLFPCRPKRLLIPEIFRFSSPKTDYFPHYSPYRVWPYSSFYPSKILFLTITSYFPAIRFLLLSCVPGRQLLLDSPLLLAVCSLIGGFQVQHSFL